MAIRLLSRPLVFSPLRFASIMQLSLALLSNVLPEDNDLLL